MPTVKYPEVTVKIHKPDSPLTIKKAKELVGWQTEEEAGKEFKDVFHLKDRQGNKVRLLNNPTNRPFSLSLAMDYALEMLRGVWAFNLETMIFDHFGYVQQGQHRLVGFILAEQMRLEDSKKWAEEYGQKGEMTLPCLLAFGCSPKKEVVDTLDTGKRRSVADVIFRNHEFGKVSDREQKALSDILGKATRLVWLRAGGKNVSDAPRFPHSEALAFIEKHPGLNEAVQHIYKLENEGDGRQITNFLSLGNAAAFCYLMATAKTDVVKYHEEGEINTSLKPKAEKFWKEFASGVGYESGSPVLALRNKLAKMGAGSGAERDEIIGTVAKAFEAWIEGSTVTAKDLAVKKTKNEAGKFILAERPRFGGVDSFVEKIAKEKPAKPPKAKKPTARKAKGKKATTSTNTTSVDASQKGKKSKGGWAVGDTAWVKSPDGDHWFGKIEEMSEDGKYAYLLTLDGTEIESDTEVWEESVDKLYTEYPKKEAA